MVCVFWMWPAFWPVAFRPKSRCNQVQVQAGQAQVQPAQVQILPAQPGKMQAALVMLPPIQAQQTKLTQADAIFVGRVVAIEPMDVEAAPAPGQANVKYRIAVVQVTESIYGLKKGAENVRVGVPGPA